MTPIDLPYVPPAGPTSTADVRTRAVLFAVWWLMFVPGLVFVIRYALVNPYVDEWAFAPALFGERPAGPWLWELHNEHRFPLPRAVYLGLFRLTGDLRAGCFVSFLGISLVASGLMHLAREVRGRAHAADAVFPLLLMHTGQGENLYMGYQLVFMLTAALAAGLLAVIVRLAADNQFRAGVWAAVLGWLLLMCGAAGLAYGAAAAAWVVYLAARGRMIVWQRFVLVLCAAVTPLYIAVYFQGYVKPSHHPESAGVYESARVGLQAQAMALGPAATGLWPAIGIAVLLVGVAVVARLASRLRADGSRALGLILYVGAGAAVAFGIGWGRSGFLDDMGFAWRYGWIAAPAVWAAYFACVLYAGTVSASFTCLGRGCRVSVSGPGALLVVAAVAAPVNTVSGFLDAETKVRPRERAWEADVRAGRSAEQVVGKHLPGHPPAASAEVIAAMRLMRDHRYTYYESLGAEEP